VLGGVVYLLSSIPSSPQPRRHGHCSTNSFQHGSVSLCMLSAGLQVLPDHSLKLDHYLSRLDVFWPLSSPGSSYSDCNVSPAIYPRSNSSIRWPLLVGIHESRSVVPHFRSGLLWFRSTLCNSGRAIRHSSVLWTQRSLLFPDYRSKRTLGLMGLRVLGSGCLSLPLTSLYHEASKSVASAVLFSFRDGSASELRIYQTYKLAL
jgi:hypothetical protein